MSDYLGQEIWRVLLAVFLGVLGGLLSGQWLLSFTFALLGYLIWFWYRLWQINQWLLNGAKAEEAPECHGILAQLVYRFQRLQRKSAMRKQRLQTLVTRLQGIIANLPYATVVLNGQNEIQWFNPRAITTLQLNPHTDPGQRLDNLVRLPEFQAFLDQAPQTMSSESDPAPELVLESPFGQQDFLAVQLVPIEQDLRLLIARNVTDQLQSQKIRRNFVANASHELRSPLTVIAGYLEMLQEDPAMPQQAQEMIHVAFKQAQRMQGLVEDLLMISRLESSSIDDQDRQLIPVAQCVEEIITTLSKNHKGTCSIESSLDKQLCLKGRETEIASVIQNLIGNALRHNPDGTTVTVTWTALRTGEARLIVADNGRGIDTKHLPHLTERFYRVDKGRSKKHGGTGLGLAIVQHVAQRHQARLDIHSEKGIGSEFRITFPANLVAACPAQDDNTVDAGVINPSH